jgi:hypothetical protein
LKDLSFHVFSR